MAKRITGILCFCTAVFWGISSMAEMPGTDPGELWHYITKTDPYTQWNYWDDHRGMLPGDAPHGSLHKVFVNEKAYSANRRPLPHGAIQVKENYNMDEKLMAITVMYKIKGYNPEAGDWFWVKFAPNGTAAPFGKPKGCIGCHDVMADNDFVMVHEFE